ncbi:MAG: hypothetical protein ACRD08_22830 [Acidimicrobiales bacterium]
MNPPEPDPRRITISFDADTDPLIELHAADTFLALLEHLHRHGIVPTTAALHITGIARR